MALTEFLTTDKALASVLNDKVVTPANAHISTTTAHIASTSNPHGVTKAQVGLTNVTDDAQIPKSIIDAAGDLIYGSADNTPAKLAKGTDGQVLTLASGLPSWGNSVKVASGSYTGDGSSTRIINIGFAAKFVCVTKRVANNAGIQLWVCNNSSISALSYLSYTYGTAGLVLSASGFAMNNEGYSPNSSGIIYDYVVVG